MSQTECHKFTDLRRRLPTDALMRKIGGCIATVAKQARMAESRVVELLAEDPTHAETIKWFVGRQNTCVGTAGYTFKWWKVGREFPNAGLYPVGLPKRKEFDMYASRFSCLEINSTFRRSMTAATAKKYVARPEMTYTTKLHNWASHKKWLKDAHLWWGRRARRLRPTTTILTPRETSRNRHFLLRHREEKPRRFMWEYAPRVGVATSIPKCYRCRPSPGLALLWLRKLHPSQNVTSVCHFETYTVCRWFGTICLDPNPLRIGGILHLWIAPAPCGKIRTREGEPHTKIRGSYSRRVRPQSCNMQLPPPTKKVRRRTATSPNATRAQRGWTPCFRINHADSRQEVLIFLVPHRIVCENLFLHRLSDDWKSCQRLLTRATTNNSRAEMNVSIKLAISLGINQERFMTWWF